MAVNSFGISSKAVVTCVADSYDAAVEVGGLPGGLDHPFGVGQHPAGPVHEHLPGLGEPGRTAVEQADAQFTLQLPDLAAERWLGHVESFGGGFETAGVGDGDHVAHEPQIH
ncbi:hypothetical protein GCM10020220_021710 [Nonomuraea rubra]